jgi:hypothetical protein
VARVRGRCKCGAMVAQRSEVTRRLAAAFSTRDRRRRAG